MSRASFFVFFITTFQAVQAVLAGSLSNLKRWEVDPSWKDSITEPSEPKVKVSYGEKTADLDASTVVNADIAKLFEGSLDYDRYVEMGMPNVIKSVVMERHPDKKLMYVWYKTRVAGQVSEQYLEVTYEPEISAEGQDAGTPTGRIAAISWKQVKAKPEWKHPDRSVFSSMAGSLYLKAASLKAVYIRYFNRGVIDTAWPDLFVGIAIPYKEIEQDARKMFQILGQKAAFASP